MELLILLLVLGIGFLAGSRWLWPKRTLWWLLQRQSNQRLKLNFRHTNYVYNDRPAVILASHLNLFVAIVVARLSDQRITTPITDIYKYHGLIRKLVSQCGIDLIQPEKIGNWSQKGLLLVTEADYKRVSGFQVPIVPLKVCGTDNVQYNKTPPNTRWLHLSFFEPLDTSLDAAQRSELLANYEVYAWDYYISLMPTIPELWIKQAKRLKGERFVADSTGVELSGIRLLTAVFCMARQLEPQMREQERVGICLPPSAGSAMAVLSVLLHGKTMVNLNYTASPEALKAAIDDAGIHTIITSGKFIEQLKHKGFFLEEVFATANIILLEDVKKQIRRTAMLRNLLRARFQSSQALIKRFCTRVSSDHTAAILFSSGSEGKPKGVELSHKNIIGNIKQSIILMQARADDVVLSILPVFHAFGMTATTLLPLIEGIPMVCHADPTDAHMIGKLAERYKATLLTGTSTFFRLYAKNRQLKARHFASLRLVIAGAEKLAPDVRQAFEKKFRKVILEGYGATELSPVASCNQHDEPGCRKNFVGTVGPSVPGSRFMIIDPETREPLPTGEAGMITQGGVNVMKGYLNNPHKTNKVIFIRDRIRWYITGDKGRLDNNGYLTILDRYSRFAKVGGEMISLGAVEEAVRELVERARDEDYELLAVAIADQRRGEQIVLIYNFDYDPDAFRSKVNASDINNLLKPSKYLKVNEIPKLGSGKTDFASARKKVDKLLEKEQ